jgi:hypothetical protein
MEAWVLIQRAGDLYVGEALAYNGSSLLEPTQPTDEAALYDLLREAGVDDYEIDCALYDADQFDGDAGERRFFFLLRVRAGAGTATPSDAQWLLQELRNPASPHRRGALILSLGCLGQEYENVLADLLEGTSADFEVEDAMHALIQMGLGDKYVPRLVAWMKGSGPPPNRFGYSRVYGLASWALLKTGNVELLRTFIDAAKDRSERWTTREHALSCLAHAIDLDHAPIGERLPPDHPYYESLLGKAERMLQEAERP